MFLEESEVPEKSLSQIIVKDMVEKRDVFYSVSAGDTAREAAATLRRLKIRATGVLEDGKLVGVVSHYDVSTKVVVEGVDPDSVKVRDIMTPDVIKVNLFQKFSECLELFDRHNISHLVVEDRNGNYYGVLSCRDMQNKMLENLKSQLHITREYAFGPTPGKK
ncbi:MAG: CBS domain-containing protein [Thermodesulfobacteriota bacterium]